MEESEARDVTAVDPEPASAPLPTLPSFPLPALPDAPSKSVLALQGLDQALVGAELVDSTGLLPIPPDGEDDGGTGLSEKMRKRLLDLGIVELFAGKLQLHACPLFSINAVSSTDESPSISPSAEPTPEVPIPSLRSTTRRLRLRANWKWQDSGLCGAHCRGE